MARRYNEIRVPYIKCSRCTRGGNTVRKYDGVTLAFGFLMPHSHGAFFTRFSGVGISRRRRAADVGEGEQPYQTRAVWHFFRRRACAVLLDRTSLLLSPPLRTHQDTFSPSRVNTAATSGTCLESSSMASRHDSTVRVYARLSSGQTRDSI